MTEPSAALSRFESGFERNENEAYYTEPRCTEALLGGLVLPHVIWEPACGRGDISRVLAAHGLFVEQSDIEQHRYLWNPVSVAQIFHVRDFLKEATVPSRDPHFGAIVTNPPYGSGGRMAEQFIERACEIMMPLGGVVVMLLRYDFSAGHGPTRMRLMHDNPQYAGKLTLPFRPRWDDWWNGHPPKKAPYVNYAWYRWDARHRGAPTEIMLKDPKNAGKQKAAQGSF